MPLSIVSSIHSAKYLPAYIGPEKVVYLVGGRMRVLERAAAARRLATEAGVTAAEQLGQLPDARHV
eukprot:scaffold1292_cov64-Phaeocystis_antarctica.AAC.7